MIQKKQRYLWLAVGLSVVLLLIVTLTVGVFRSYQRPYRKIIKESGLDPNLVYAVIKAESGFREHAKSTAGAVGLMQILPSTAEFVCEMNGLEFSPEKLNEGDYNVTIGCLYLNYLLKRFTVTETALCAYNAGEGTVSEWLSESAYSADGLTLKQIPYAETRSYIKKITKFRKIYEILY